MLKTRILKADAGRGAYVCPMAFDDGAPDTATYGPGTRLKTPELTLEFYVDGRRHLLRLTDAQAGQIARTAARAYGDATPDHPNVFDVEQTHERMIQRNRTRHAV